MFDITKKTHVPTLGVEMEYQVIDGPTLQLSSATRGLLEEGAQLFGEHIKPEFHAPVVECISTVCQTVREVVEQTSELRRTVVGLARKADLRVVSASTHPITNWREVKITEDPRYQQIESDLGDVARSNLIYGMHCHLGIPDPDIRIQAMNAARNFLPHLLALTASSPFWQGRDTAMSSVRTSIFARFPRTGMPEFFSSMKEFDQYVQLLVQTGCIDNAKKIWWDIRPHPFYPTIEFRSCDTPTRVRELAAVVAFIQAMGMRLCRLAEQDLGYRLHRRAFLKENMFRAARYGTEGKLVDFSAKREVPTKDLIRRLVDEWKPEFDHLGLDREREFLEEILEQGNSAIRQRAVFEQHGNLEEVVRHLVRETEEDL